MPDFNDAIQDLPQSFRREIQELDRAGIHRWSSIRALTDLQLSQLARSGQASPRNLKRLRGMADLVCGLELPPQDAALLMHAGIATPSPIPIHARAMSSAGSPIAAAMGVITVANDHQMTPNPSTSTKTSTSTMTYKTR